MSKRNQRRKRSHSATTAAAPAARTTTPATGHTKSFMASVQSGFGGGRPGHWATDHREQLNHFTGWNYVAIRATAIQVSQADVLIFADAASQKAHHAKRLCQRGELRYSTYKSLLKAYGRDEQQSEPLETSHPLYKLLRRPNPTQSGSSARYVEAMQLCLAGNCFIAKIPNRLKRTVERYIIPMPWLQPVDPCPQYPKGAYRVTPASTMQSLLFGDGFDEVQRSLGPLFGTTIPAEYMIVKRWPHPLYPDDGYPATAAGAHWIDTAEQVDLARWYHLRNGADPSLVICPSDPTETIEEDELKAGQTKFNERYAGVDKTGTAMLTSRKVDITTLSATPKEMSYEGGHDQLRNAIMALHGTPLIAAGLSDGGTYAAFVASIKQHQMMTVQPLLNLMAEEETEQQAPEFGGGLVVEYEAKGIDDPAVLEAQLRTDISAGAIEVNELRLMRGRDRKPYGDVPCKAASMGGGPGGGGADNAGELGAAQQDERGAGGMAGADGTESGMGSLGKPPALLGKRFSLNGSHKGNGHAKNGVVYP